MFSRNRISTRTSGEGRRMITRFERQNFESAKKRFLSRQNFHKDGFMKMRLYTFILLIICAGTVASAEVKELADPTYYSAGTLSEEKINDWFAKNIKIEDFDIWTGKKKRIYLNGSWKFRRIAVPVKNLNTHCHANTVDVPDSDYGEKHHFQDKDYDDSKWFNQPVPWAWIYKFKIPLNKKGEQYVKDGNPYRKKGRRVNLGWYRRNFTIPESWKGKRVFLTFRAVTWKSSVYINGKLIGIHENSNKPIHWIAARRVENKFTFDLSRYISPGENTLAVKVYAPCPNGGIWQEVYLEVKPKIYVKKALVTPELSKKTIRVKAYIVNSTDKKTTLRPEIELGPWKSTRYNIAKGMVQKIKISPLVLHPGLNEAEFELPVQNPQYWSPEHPFLYHLVIKDINGQIIGQERFGFRSFAIGKNNFKLNGKAILLRGTNCSPHTWNYPGNSPLILRFGILNIARKMEYVLNKYMKAGFNLMRCQSGYPVHIYFDIADEIGLLIYDDELAKAMPEWGILSMKNEKVVLSDKFKRAIKNRCMSSYNHPSYVLKSCQNEAFDTQTYDIPVLNKTGWAPLLDAIYDEYKKYDMSRPISSSSGRGPTSIKFYYKSWKKAKSDFDVCHPYVTNRQLKDAELDSFKYSYKKFKDAYARDNKGQSRIMLDGESSEFYTFQPYGSSSRVLKTRQRDFLPHMKDGEFERKWLARNLKTIDRKYLSEACEYSLIPFNVSVDVDASCRIQAWHNQQLMELERRKRNILAGYVLHMPAIFKDFSFGKVFPHTFKAAVKSQQAILACFDGFFNCHLVGGNIEKTILYLINDSEHVLKNAKVEAFIQAKKGGLRTWVGSFVFDKINIGGMEKQSIELRVPKLKTGHYKLQLEVISSRGRVSLNDYECYILNPEDIMPTAKLSSTIVYAPKRTDMTMVRKLTDILKKLRVTYRLINSYSELKKNSGILILPPYSNTGKDDQKALCDWIAAGGKMLSFAQRSLPQVMPRGRYGSIGKFGWWTELTMRNHPVFSGLNQDDFRFWAGKTPDEMRLVDHWILPLNEGVLAMGMSLNYRMGMSICEARFGNGRYLLSQLKSINRFGLDSVATKYTLNLMNYVLGAFNDPSAPVLNKNVKIQKQYNVNSAKCFQINLRKYANMGFVDKVAHDGKGGWSDQGPFNDAHGIPTGRQVFAGVAFDIINPASNNNKSCIVLQGVRHSKTGFLPLKVKNIKIRRKAKKLYFLVASCWTKDKYPVALFDIYMNISLGGTIRMNTLTLEKGRNIGDWWNPEPAPEAIVAWTGMAGKRGELKEIGIYVVEWNNPEPNVEIGEIDFKSSGWSVPILLAISGEEE